METTEQLNFLLEHGCHIVQGYLFGVPMEKALIEPLLAELDNGVDSTATRRALAAANGH